MRSQVQVAVATYIRACQERDPAARLALFESCLAEQARMVTRTRELSGRTQIIEELTRSLTDPRLAEVRVASIVDATGRTFRYRALAVFRDGTSAETFDAGEIDASGRIALILTFPGPLPDAPASSL